MNGVSHTLWIFDWSSTARLSGNQIQTLDGALAILNNLYLANCVDGSTVSAAVAIVATGAIIAPGPNDAVVFLVADTSHSMIVRAGASNALAANDPTALGLTSTPMAGGGVAEVYWGRCMNNDEVAASIFHEAAHLKSDGDPGMHTFATPNVGGSGVRVLSANGSHFTSPSSDDLDYYIAHIPSTVALRTTAP